MFGGQKFLGGKEFWVLKNWVKSNKKIYSVLTILNF